MNNAEHISKELTRRRLFFDVGWNSTSTNVRTWTLDSVLLQRDISVGCAPPPIRGEGRGNADGAPAGRSACDSLFLVWANAVETGGSMPLAGA
jgi:hypothetical protein